MRGKVTKRGVDKLEPDGNAEAVLWDTELKGFGIRARSGGSKSYILHYRAGAGRTAPLHKITIGKHGSPWTPDSARAEAKRLLGDVAAGRDPARPATGSGRFQLQPADRSLPGGKRQPKESFDP